MTSKFSRALTVVFWTWMVPDPGPFLTWTVNAAFPSSTTRAKRYEAPGISTPAFRVRMLCEMPFSLKALYLAPLMKESLFRSMNAKPENQ